MISFLLPSNVIRAVSLVLLLLSFHGGILILSGQDEPAFPHALQQHLNDSSCQDHHHHPSVNCSDMDIRVPLCGQHNHHYQYHGQQQSININEGTADSYHPTSAAAAAATMDNDVSSSDLITIAAILGEDGSISNNNEGVYIDGIDRHDAAMAFTLNQTGASAEGNATDNSTSSSSSSSSSDQHHSDLEISIRSISTGPAMEDSTGQHDHHHHHHYNEEHSITSIYVISNELRGTTPPPGSPSPIHTASSQSVWRAHSNEQHHSSSSSSSLSSSLDHHENHHHYDDNHEHSTASIYVISNQLRGTTPPPASTSPIHTASSQSVWRAHSDQQHHSSPSSSSSSCLHCHSPSSDGESPSAHPSDDHLSLAGSSSDDADHHEQTLHDSS